MNREVPFVKLSLHFISCTNIKKNPNVLAQPTQPTSWVSPTPGRQISPTQPTAVCTATVDLGFLIDGSGSIEQARRGNFKKELNFVKQIVNGFKVCKKSTHVGVIIFSSNAKVISGFDEHYDKRSVLAAIDSIPYPGAGTKIGKALDLARTQLYSKSARSGIPNMLIVLTDGQSMDQVTGPAQRLRDSGVTIFAVGIGGGYNLAELKAMATDPDSQHVYRASFNNLNAIVQSIKNRACLGSGGTSQPAPPIASRAPTPTQPPTQPTQATSWRISPTPGTQISPTQPTAVCTATVDLGFLIDGSGSIEQARRGNFKKELNFVKQIVNGFKVCKKSTHVGVIIFSSNAKVISGFDEHYDKRSVLAAIESIPYPGAGTKIGKALDLARTQLYAKSARSGIPNMLIVLTDGLSMDQVTGPAQRLRDSGVTIFVVGIGGGCSRSELKAMATDPDSQHVYRASFKNLNSIVQSIKNRACAGSGGVSQRTQKDPFLQSPLTVCEARMDLAILIDGSQSVEYFGAGNFRKCLRFVQYLVSSFNIAREGTHVGMVVFSNTAEVVFRFEEYLSLTLISRAIGNIKYLQGGIHIGNALDVAWNQLIDASARQDVPKVLLVMTVGASQDDVDEPSRRLRNMGVTIFTLGLGESFDINQLNEMATDPNSKHVFTAEFSALDSPLIEKIKNNVCKVAGGIFKSKADHGANFQPPHENTSDNDIYKGEIFGEGGRTADEASSVKRHGEFHGGSIGGAERGQLIKVDSTLVHHGRDYPVPVALYPLNEKYRARDVIGGNLPGVASKVIPADGPFNKSKNSYLFFGKSDSFIELPNNGKLDTKNSMSILAWILPRSAGPIFNYKIDGWGVNFWMAKPRKLFAQFVSRTPAAPLPAIKSTHVKPNKWNFVGTTFDQNSGQASLWINGKKEDERHLGNITLATNYPVRIGSRIGDNRNYRGRISCLQVYGIALRREQINNAKIKCRSLAGV
ncbi:von Willebrand factor A domain-containing protein 2-like [Montipora foliosa]|uniref:von Willebrand factor A domain-containing protein 2-like n=1 Tax=Montipora foliosa TaxID=591990 RepID=UPI0035F164AF